MNLINEASPHFHGKGSTQWIMGCVVIALLPALVASALLYGMAAPLLVLVCVVTAAACEQVCCMLMKRPSTVTDLSCVVTGMLFAYTLPSNCPIWVAVLGTAFAIVVVKMLFGGIGCNFANPAVAGRVFVMVALPSALSGYPNSILNGAPDAVTGATPLALAAAGSQPYSLMDMLIGNHAGALGETCIIALLAGYVFLLVVKVVDAWATLPYIASVAVILGVAGEDVPYQLMAGGLALGAFFMATDYTTTPMTPTGKVIFGLGCGVITALVRLFASAPEGVAFSILFMNMFVPLIDRYTRPKMAGGIKHALS